MSYRTISIKLLRPTAVKRRILEDAMRRYAAAFEKLLRASRPACRQLSRMADGPTEPLCPRPLLSLADAYDAQPFKDALQRDVRAVLHSYLGRIRAGRRADYPVCRTSDEDLQRILSKSGNFSCSEIYTNLAKYDTLRPVSFCRYAQGRDYSLLKGENSKRYYCKLYLLNRQNAIAAPPADDYLRDIVSGEVLRDRHVKRRYLLLPLEIGAWQQKHLLEVEQGVALPKNALLHRKGRDYYLTLRLLYQDPAPCAPACTLGVARTAQGLGLCVGGAPGRFRDLAAQPGPQSEGQLCRLANQVCAAADRLSAQLVVENLSRSGDGAVAPALSAGEYQRFVQLLRARAVRAGLPPVVAVSVAGLYQRCPACGAWRRGNVAQGDLFLCVACGHAQPLQQVGCANLAGALERYGRARLRVRVTRVAGRVKFQCPALELKLETGESPKAADWFLQQVQALLRQPEQRLTARQKSVKRKMGEWPAPPGGWFYYV